MKTVAEIIDMVEEYGRSERQGYQDWHERLADIERAIKEREAVAVNAIEEMLMGYYGAGETAFKELKGAKA